MVKYLRLFLICHYCEIRKEWVQERIGVNEEKPYSYVCGACSEVLWVVDTEEGEGPILNMDFTEIGKWVEQDGGEYRRVSTQMSLPWVGVGKFNLLPIPSEPSEAIEE